MKWIMLAGSVALAAAMFWADAKDLKRNKHDKWAYASVLAGGVALCGLLLLAPDVPGPTAWIRPWFEPLGKWLAP
ncbi:hypothetical protein ACFSR7_10455 [Cohnella sp. GCM10020058]|uniref:hypothetical protein n=1 Tax=Cohnella sp. GCM10020058 TaxID=3317330 RepID=UPI003628FA1C